MSTIEDFQEWLKDVSRFSKVDDHVEVVEYVNQGPLDKRLRVRLYTDNNSYSITAHERHDHGYLGCIASSRKPRAGETWTRGNDLTDGPFTKDTWHAILADIVSFELVHLHKTDKRGAAIPDLPVADEPESAVGEPTVQASEDA